MLDQMFGFYCTAAVVGVGSEGRTDGWMDGRSRKGKHHGAQITLRP